MRFFFLLFPLLGLQCTSISHHLWDPVPHPAPLDNAVYLKSQKKWDQAEAEVQNYLVQTKEIYWQGAALLLLGEIQEESRRDDEAEKTYKRLLNHAGYETFQVAKALYKLSWIHERKQDCLNVVVNLTDLKKILFKSDEFVREVETPARIANCYYWLNKWDTARELRATAKKNYESINHQKVPREVFWRAHLYLSYVGVSTKDRIDRRYREIIPLVQKDLYLMIEQAPDPFFKAAQDRLIDLYAELFKEITEKPRPKSSVEKNEANLLLLKELSLFIDFVEELKSFKNPAELRENDPSEFFSTIYELEQQAHEIAKKLELGLQKDRTSRGSR